MIYFLQIAPNLLLDTKKINILINYCNFGNIFLFDSVVELTEYINVKNYKISLINN